MIRDVEVSEAGSKGKGVFALRGFRRGDFIFRRRNGRVVTGDEIARLTPEDQMHLTELDWNRFAVVLPPGCYLNHSCEPNAMRSGVKVFAWRDVPAGHEITIDYRLNAFDGECWPCACGSASCTGWCVGSFFEMGEGRQLTYVPYAPHFIRQEWRRRRARCVGRLRHPGAKLA
jgi:hypothetical protein